GRLGAHGRAQTGLGTICYNPPAGGVVESPKPPLDGEAAPVLYRGRSAGSGASDAFMVVADGQIDQGRAGQSAIGGPAQLYRFEVLSANGKKVAVAIAIGMEPGPVVEIHLHLDD